MMIVNQDHPLTPGLLMALGLVSPPLKHTGAGFGSTERIRTCVTGVLDYRQDGVLEWFYPLHLLIGLVSYGRQCDVFFPKP